MEHKKNDWMQNKWRPAMGWMYMTICIMDFILFPIFWSIVQVVTKQTVTPWNPLTLQGAGLFHIAMGAVLGIAAFGRTQEKINGTSYTEQNNYSNTQRYNTQQTPTVTIGFGGRAAPPPAHQPLI